MTRGLQHREIVLHGELQQHHDPLRGNTAGHLRLAEFSELCLQVLVHAVAEDLEICLINFSSIEELGAPEIIENYKKSKMQLHKQFV